MSKHNAAKTSVDTKPAAPTPSSASSASQGLPLAGIQFGLGQTRHKRVWPRVNAFAVGSVFMRLPMRSLGPAPQRLCKGLLGINRAAPLAFADRDHFNRSAEHGSALAALDGILHQLGLDCCTGDYAGEVWLHTFPRVLGYAFKPVSFWFCHDRAGLLRAVVAEVHNTFGQQHCYVLRHADHSPMHNGETLQAEKVFHVSPFFPVRGSYAFRWAVHESQSVMRIEYQDDAHQPPAITAPTLTTSISGTHHAVNAALCLRVLLSYPFHAVTVVLRIHWQALKLWLKGARFHRLPPLPADAVTQSSK